MFNLIKNISSKKMHHELICVLNKGTEDWVIGGTAREIVKNTGGSTRIVYSKSRKPKAEAYLYLNWYTYVDHYHKGRLPKQGKKIVYFTHPRATPISEKSCIDAFNESHRVIFMNEGMKNEFISKGLVSDKAFVLPGAADPDFFYPHKRNGNGFIGFCSAFYERKNPKLMVDLVKSMPHRNFLLLGKNWHKFEGFVEMLKLPNFTYVEEDYKNYPEYYNKMDVFVSTSYLEGGPIPLIEAMMSNVFPVSSDTGFAPDIIKHGKNGFLFDVNKSQSNDVCKLIEMAFKDKTTNISSTTRELTWKFFSDSVLDLARKP